MSHFTIATCQQSKHMLSFCSNVRHSKQCTNGLQRKGGAPQEKNPIILYCQRNHEILRQRLPQSDDLYFVPEGHALAVLFAAQPSCVPQLVSLLLERLALVVYTTHVSIRSQYEDLGEACRRDVAPGILGPSCPWFPGWPTPRSFDCHVHRPKTMFPYPYFSPIHFLS